MGSHSTVVPARAALLTHGVWQSHTTQVRVVCCSLSRGCCLSTSSMLRQAPCAHTRIHSCDTRVSDRVLSTHKGRLVEPSRLHIHSVLWDSVLTLWACPDRSLWVYVRIHSVLSRRACAPSRARTSLCSVPGDSVLVLMGAWTRTHAHESHGRVVSCLFSWRFGVWQSQVEAFGSSLRFPCDFRPFPLL